MFVTLIKYFSMIICCFYIYLKLLNIKSTKKIYLFLVIFTLLFLPELYLLRKYAAPFSIIIMVLLFSFFTKIVLNTPLNLSLTISAISFGIAYSAFLVSAALMYPIGSYIAFLTDEYPTDLFSMICIGMFQFLFSTIPFKFKRLKNGMPFLIEYGSSDIGVNISVSLLLAVSCFGISKKADLVSIIPVFFSLLYGFSLLFWWRNSLTKKYIDKIKAKEIDELQKTLQENNKQIEQLKYHNDELSKIIHKDNKLIPAMEYAVREYLLSSEHETSNKENLIRAKELLEQFECISKERSGIIKNYDIINRKLSSTNIISIDTLLSYMLQKAKEYNISLDLSLSGSVKYLVYNIIDELDIKTLLADLIDNAIIATKKASRKNILIIIGITTNYYSIDIFDSGYLFNTEILLNLGIKKTTSHANEGGSGIGLMTTFDIIKKNKASFVIEELLNNNLFTKKVSICFDNLGQFRIKTMRADVKKALSNRTDIIFIKDSKMEVQTGHLSFKTIR